LVSSGLLARDLVPLSTKVIILLQWRGEAIIGV